MSNANVPVPNDRILEEANLKIALAKKYLTKLSTFGITKQWIGQMQQDIDEVTTIPSFELQKTELKELTGDKDDKLAECVEWGRILRTRMSLAVADNLLKNVEFPRSSWTECERNESKLIAFMPTLIQLAKNHGKALVTVGQTSEFITQGEQLYDELCQANQAQEAYNIQRKAVTRNRQKAFRSLYDKVNRINKIGQIVFKDDDSTQVLFESSWTQDISYVSEQSSVNS
ncbi:MAG: hypothetical protein AB4041_07750 [Microcystaceae cyanobacterium]